MKKIKIGFSILYLGLIASVLFAVFYSMPANDDFAWALEWFSPNRIVECFKRIGWNYMNWFGQSGVIAVAIQVLFNPLYWFKDVGHSFGICMVIIFLLLYAGIIIALKRIARYFLGIENELIVELFAFFTVALLFTTYYYADVYNWWSGIPGYSMMMVLMLFNFGNTAKYANTHQQSTYISMIITGVIVCTGLMNCVAMGLFYLLVIFIMNRKDGDSFGKKALPLVLYVISGLITVVAPGNYKRTAADAPGGPDFINSIKVTLYDMNMRLFDTLKHYPWVLALFIAILVLGIVAKSEEKPSLIYIITGALFTLIAAFGAMYPYIAGERKEIGIELATRVNYMEDYILFIGFAMVIFSLGRWLGSTLSINLNVKQAVAIAATVFVISCALAKLMGTLMFFLPYDIYRQRAQIKEIYYTWEDIIAEIEETDSPEVDVVRVNVPWTRFSYPVGIDGGANFVPEEMREYYGGCNQCAAMWYGKEAVRVYIN